MNGTVTLRIMTIRTVLYSYNAQARNPQRHVGLDPPFMLKSALTLGSKLEGGARAERFAISVDDPVDGFVAFGATTFVNEGRFTRFEGLASSTRLIFGASPLLTGESCGIMLDRLLPFSARCVPTMDRLLPLPLLPSAALEPPLPIFAGGRGSRDLETFPAPLELSKWFITSDSTR